MKLLSIQKNYKFTALLLFLLFVSGLILNSCKSKDSISSLVAYLQIANAADGSAPQDFYSDNNKAATSVAYGQSTSFAATGPGTHTGSFRNSGTATTNATVNLSLAAGQHYSIFYTDGNSATVLQDDRTTPQPGKARVRFINLCSAINSNIDFAISGGAKLVSAIGYKGASSYYDVDPASAFDVNVNGSGSSLISIPASLQAGNIYSVYLSGATNATVSFHVITEN